MEYQLSQEVKELNKDVVLTTQVDQNLSENPVQIPIPVANPVSENNLQDEISLSKEKNPLQLDDSRQVDVKGIASGKLKEDSDKGDSKNKEQDLEKPSNKIDENDENPKLEKEKNYNLDQNQLEKVDTETIVQQKINDEVADEIVREDKEPKESSSQADDLKINKDAETHLEENNSNISHEVKDLNTSGELCGKKEPNDKLGEENVNSADGYQAKRVKIVE